jgi:spore coat polysaccharide biosynthesis protein SpsF (cytidylyltransferase family)
MSSTKTVGIVNVRMGSTRLPGKALLDLCGKPLLQHLLERLRLARSLDAVTVATSTLPANDAIESFCARLGIPCFRGSEDDVLSRTLGGLQSMQATTGVIVFGDGPLIDPAIVDDMVARFRSFDPPYDFVGNDLETSYPPGMEVEVCSVAALADADRRCHEPEVREHGTLYVRRNPGRYRVLNVIAPAPLRRPELELEVDTEDDLGVVQAVLAHFRGRVDFALGDIIEFIDAHPDIAALNRDVPRRWKAFRQQEGGS